MEQTSSEEERNKVGTMVAYLSHADKIIDMLKRLKGEGIDIIVEGSTKCMSNLDRCILDTLNENNPDFILIENSENNNGIMLYQLIKEEGTIDSIPVLFIGVEDEAIKLMALELGALDYITNFNPEEVYIKIKNYINIGKKAIKDRINDRLTGVYTRNYAEDRIKKNIIIVKEEGERLSILLIDIDDMKLTNKKLGKKKGDEILKKAADFFKKEIRSKDFIYRYAGDKFVIAFHGKTSSEVLNSAVRLQQKIKDLSEGYGINISFTGGISILNSKTKDYDDLITDALKSLASAKREGKGNIYIQDGFTAKNKEKSILIADGDKVIREILSTRYKNKGYKVYSAEDGENALILLHENNIDLLIVEFVSFTMAENQMINKVKSINKYVKIIIISSQKSEMALDSVMRNGAEEYVQKPFSIVELDLRIKKLIG
jgi:two-component system, cell cycle response regulator